MIDYTLSEDLAILRLQSPPLSAITPAMLGEMCAGLRRAGRDANVRGVVVTGGTEHFSAGADLAIFRNIRTGQDAVHVSRVFQEAFQAIEDSPKPVVAAVAGHVLGGALELAMACHFRVAAESSRFSMPEVRLGINPGAGGTQRLPRLVGLEAALEMLLGGRPIAAPQALAWGLVDVICPGERLLAAAAEILRAGPAARRTISRSDRLAGADSHRAVLEAAAARVAAGRPELIAPRTILEAVRAGLERPAPAGFLCEQEGFRSCMATRATQNRIYVQCARRDTAANPESRSLAPARISRAAVVGMGTMGTGIAQALITAGIRVTALDERGDALQAAAGRIRDSLARRAAQGKLPAAEAEAALARLTTTSDWPMLADAQLVIEAVYEDPAVKRAVLARLDKVCPPDAILASNTSTINLDLLAAGMAHPQRLVGLHFFHPAQQVPLVEVVRRSATPPAVTAAALGLVAAIKKTPVLVENREGFLVDRLFVPYLAEAFWLLEEGATPADVDRAMSDFGFPMGPFQLIDMSGLDILVMSQRILRQAFPHHGGLSSIVDLLAAAGHLGQKTGAGVYHYEQGNHTPHPHRAAEEAIAKVRAERSPRPGRLPRDEIVRRLMLRMAAEAFCLLEERIVQRPADIDVAMVLSIGLPDFRGGVLRYACDLGLGRVLGDLGQLAEQCGPRYRRCRLLEQAAADESVLGL